MLLLLLLLLPERRSDLFDSRFGSLFRQNPMSHVYRPAEVSIQRTHELWVLCAEVVALSPPPPVPPGRGFFVSPAYFLLLVVPSAVCIPC